MRWSQTFIPTLREAPAGVADPGHAWLMRAGYLRRSARGNDILLPLGRRAAGKIADLIRAELAGIASEFGETWEETAPASGAGAPLSAAVGGRSGPTPAAAGPFTALAEIAAKELRSYKQLPQVWWQMQTLPRAAAAPAGLPTGQRLAAGLAWMSDAGARDDWERRLQAIGRRIGERCGLRAVRLVAGAAAWLPASAPAPGWSLMAMDREQGEVVAQCAGCGYAARLAWAEARPPTVADAEPPAAPELFPTPTQRTIAEVAALAGEPAGRFIKSLLYLAGGRPVLALLRGDDALQENKLAAALGVAECRPATAAEVLEHAHAPAGFVGPGPAPAERTLRLVADHGLQGRRNLIAGANRAGWHLRGVTPGRDFAPEWADLRAIQPGDGCARCGHPLHWQHGLLLGEMARLPAATVAALGVRVLDAGGRPLVPAGSAFWIGIEAILAAAVEQNHDAAGFWLPSALAPFSLLLTPVHSGDAAIAAVTERLYARLVAAGVAVLLDDRSERAGVKFKDGDLLGIPLRVTIGQRAGEGMVEVVHRATGERRDVREQDVAEGELSLRG